MKIYIWVIGICVLVSGCAALNDNPTSFRTIEVNGQEIVLADSSYVENGVQVTCQQYVEGISENIKDKGMTVTIGKTCNN